MELTTALTPISGTTAISSPAWSVHKNNRAMEIEYGLTDADDRYFAGYVNTGIQLPFAAPETVPCTIPLAGNQDGYVYRVGPLHNGFRTHELTAETEDKKALNYSILPNPSEGQITITYNVKDDTHQTSLKIYNLAGKLVHESYLKSSIGQHKTQLNVDLPNGTYIIQTGTSEVIYGTEKLIILK